MGNPWLDAGIVPFSTLTTAHDRDYWREWFPADFITESFPGQFRNWFYSMLVMATVLENTRPFETVLGFASVLGFDGSQMSKSKGTAIWFAEAAGRVGADTMRWLYASQPPEQDVWFPKHPDRGTEMDGSRRAGMPVRLNDAWLQHARTLDKLWNVYYFFVTYANIDRFEPAAHTLPPERSDVDRWLLSELQEVVRAVTGVGRFDAAQAARRSASSSSSSRTGTSAACGGISGKARWTARKSAPI